MQTNRPSGTTRLIPTVQFPSGDTVPILGQGTWRMGMDAASKSTELKALLYGLEQGLRLIDTAEMYGDGQAELLIGEAINGKRDNVFLVSKVIPQNAGRKETIAACERSLRRLKTDRLDLYLLHWRGSVPLEDTVEAFTELLQSGKIRNWGVSNFDLSDMQELMALPEGQKVATNQILYNPLRRGVEWDLLPWCRDRGIPIMAYSPLEEGRIIRHPALQAIADRLGVKPAQVAMSWLYQQPQVISIAKAGNLQHIDENLEALSIHLDDEALQALNRAFPPPNGPTPLEMI